MLIHFIGSLVSHILVTLPWCSPPSCTFPQEGGSPAKSGLAWGGGGQEEQLLLWHGPRGLVISQKRFQPLAAERGQGAGKTQLQDIAPGPKKGAAALPGMPGGSGDGVPSWLTLVCAQLGFIFGAFPGNSALSGLGGGGSELPPPLPPASDHGCLQEISPQGQGHDAVGRQRLNRSTRSDEEGQESCLVDKHLALSASLLQCETPCLKNTTKSYPIFLKDPK